MWLVDEMQLRLLRGEAEKFQLLMKEVQNRYMKEPGVAQALLSMLQRFGLVGPDGNAVAPPAGAADQAAQPVGAASDGGLWTPDGSAAPQGGKEQGESKLWIPD